MKKKNIFIDFVRMEVATALERKVRVIPVLVSGVGRVTHAGECALIK